jgi:uncharacterized protein
MGGGTMIAGGGIGTVVIVILALLFGKDPGEILNQAPATQQSQGQPGTRSDDAAAAFVSQVLADTEDTWTDVLPKQAGGQYQAPTLVLFDGATQSACGTGQAAMGPFYCPLDHKVYIDLSFYRDMETKLGAGGDFAQAYVIAHEVGHHVQTMTGISEQVQNARRRAGEREGNELSVRQELQADCFAGVWAHHSQKSRQTLEAGDIEEGLNAASAIGDDRLQRKSQGYVVPESFTHGSSAQRVQWFTTGFKSGDMRACDAFNSPGV